MSKKAQEEVNAQSSKDVPMMSVLPTDVKTNPEYVSICINLTCNLFRHCLDKIVVINHDDFFLQKKQTVLDALYEDLMNESIKGDALKYADLKRLFKEWREDSEKFAKVEASNTQLQALITQLDCQEKEQLAKISYLEIQIEDQTVSSHSV